MMVNIMYLMLGSTLLSSHTDPFIILQKVINEVSYPYFFHEISRFKISDNSSNTSPFFLKRPTNQSQMLEDTRILLRCPIMYSF
jgi:hypothetical protein